MNYYAARQTADKRYWHWTCRNDGMIYPCQPCTSDCTHETQEEAERHHHEYELSKGQVGKLSDRAHYPCEVCGSLTQTIFSCPDHSRLHHLCDEHANAETFATLEPFKAGRTVTSSW